MEHKMNGMVFKLLGCFYILQTMEATFLQGSNFTIETIERLGGDLRILKKQVADLKKSIDITEVEKMEIKEVETFIQLMVTKINDLVENDNAGVIFLKQHYSKVYNCIQDVDNIYDKSQERKQNRLAVQSIEGIEQNNTKIVVKSFLLINDEKKLNEIVKRAYNKEKRNFYKILQVGDEIPSILLSLQIFKFLKKVAEDNNHTDENTDILLYESITTNVIQQISTDEITKTEAELILEDIEFSLKGRLVHKIETLVEEGVVSSDLEEILNKIIGVLKRYKFFRAVSEHAVKIVYEKFGYGKVMESLNSIKLIVPKIILLNALFMEISQKGETAETIAELIPIQNSIHNAYNEIKGFEEIWPSVPNVKFSLIRQLKRAILNEYYHNKEISDLTINCLQKDENLFLDVMKTVVKLVYDKILARDLLKLFSESAAMGPCVVGFISVYEAMKEKGDLVTEDAYTLLFLYQFIINTYETADSMNVSLEMGHQFYDITVGLVKNTMTVENITLEEYKNHKGIKGGFDEIIRTILANSTERMNPVALLDIIVHSKRHPLLRLSALLDVHREITGNAYVFQIAEGYYSIESELGGIMDYEHRRFFEIFKNTLPLSVKIAVFSPEVYIKHRKRGGEYLCLFKNLSDSAFTYTRGSRGNNSKWSLEKTGHAEIYKIKNLELNEYLYASEVFDEDNRLVLSSEKGQFSESSGKWHFFPTEGGVFIKSVIYKEYLVTGLHTKRDHRYVYTIRNGYDSSETKWAIEEFHPTY